MILQLQSKDIDELLGASKGKGKDGDTTDAELAVTTYQKELEQKHTLLSDSRMGQSLTAAISSDEALLLEALAAEDVVTNDRALAQRLAEEDAESQVTSYVEPFPTHGFGWTSNLPEGSRENFGDNTPGGALFGYLEAAPESSASAESCQSPRNDTPGKSVSCDETLPAKEIFRAPCNHCYCRTCLHTLFEN